FWYADALNRTNSQVSKSVNLNVNDYAPAVNFGFGFGGSLLRQPVQNPKLEVVLWGGSSLPGNGVEDPDHHVRISLNDEHVSDVKFDGLESKTDITQLADIQNGINLIKIQVPNESGYIYDLIRLDHVTLRYPRKFIAEKSSLVFDSNWTKFRVKGLPGASATVIRVDKNRNAYFMMQRGRGSCTQDCVYFSGDTSGLQNSYFVASTAGLKKPSIVIAVDDSALSTAPAKFVIISHPDFIGTANQLLEGYAAEIQVKYETVDIVDVQAIYAAHSGGVVDAYAISEYLLNAYKNRGTRHVLLVGGDVYDYRDYTGTGAKSFIPSIYMPIANNVNAVPSDASYTLIDDDLVPDMTISRLPVRSTADLQNLVFKRADYIARSYSNTAVFAADKLDASNYSFKSDSERLVIDHFKDWSVNEVYLDDTEISAATSSIFKSINDGVALASYFGHSSVDRWSIRSILSGEDVANLSNFGSPTVVTQWGCWNTFYVSPENDSMAHRFLLEGQQGAVTVMGAASLTQANAEKRMAGYLFGNLKQGMSIGDAVKSAKQKIAADTPFQIDVLLGWTVLGFDDMAIFQ
ncbi:MAG: hypothetical protein ACI8XV_002686, partial [Arenicella sp.]